VFFCHEDEAIKHLFSFSVDLLGLYGQSFRSILSYIRHEASRIFFGNWLNGADSRFKLLIRGGSVCRLMVAMGMYE
jgi:hypothetical protein